MWIAVGLVLLIAYGNLRGIREAGRIFAVPTYFFIANMVLLIVVGIGARPSSATCTPIRCTTPGPSRIGTPGERPAPRRVGLFIVMKAFASGGSALTGTEAISNGVSVFRPPRRATPASRW